MASLGIGEALRRERERQGISLEDIARNTKIPVRFLDAVECEDFNNLPGLVFARNFVRQYAEALRLDAEPMLAGLPKLDESNIQLPDPPARPRRRSSYSRNTGFSSLAWSIAAIAAGIFLYSHFSHSLLNSMAHLNPMANPMAKMRAGLAAFRGIPLSMVRGRSAEAAPPSVNAAQSPPPAPAPRTTGETPAPPASSLQSVQVVVTAIQAAWVQLSADGKTSFTGTLMPNEKREISAAEQVKIVAGNAGGLMVSLNGRPLEPLGPIGQVRVVRLTAEGPQFLPTSPLPAPDPL